MTEEAYTVPISLAGTEHRLRPGVDAALALSRAYGGLVPLQHKMLVQDFDVYTDIILAGLGKLTDATRAQNPPGPARKEIQDALFAEGIVTATGEVNRALLVALDDFVAALLNGGRPVHRPKVEAHVE